MKTPNRIKLVYGLETHKKYNPVTDTYEVKESEDVEIIPCLVHKITESTNVKDYGLKKEVVISVKFATKPKKDFRQAIFEGDTYERLDDVNTTIKQAIKFKKVVSI